MNFHNRFDTLRRRERSRSNSRDQSERGFFGPDSLEPLPLIPEPERPAPFPMEELGALRAPSEAIARVVQAPDALAAQSVLAVAALATQAYADIEMPHGGVSPISLFFLSICESGDRKTSTDRRAGAGIEAVERELKEAYAVEFNDWNASVAAWTATKKRIESGAKNTSEEEIRLALEDLGPAPEPPLIPVLSLADVTLEGLVKAWATARPALGLMTSEGGIIIGGHAMSDEARLRSAASLSQLWDGGSIKRVRVSDGPTFLYGRRLTTHIMIQPDAAKSFLKDPVVKDQGLLARFLTAAPASLRGARPFQTPNRENLSEIEAFGERVYNLLKNQPVPRSRDEGLRPRLLSFSPDAKELWLWAYNEIEAAQAPDLPLSKIGAFASKAAEHIARLASVMTIFEDHGADVVSKSAMESAIGIMNYYITETLRLMDVRVVSQDILDAEALREWILNRVDDEISFRDIVRAGPRATRKKADADRALAILIAHGWLRHRTEKAGIFRVIRDGAAAANAGNG